MDESEVYLQSIIDAFNWGSRLLWPENVKPSEFIKIAIELQRFRKIEAPSRFGHDWPVQPTTFPLFMRAGFSALDVANKFSESMDSCIQVAKVESVGMPRDYNALSDVSAHVNQ